MKYMEDIRNIQLLMQDMVHIIIIYNELLYRGYNVDVGIVEIREKILGNKLKLILYVIKRIRDIIFK